MIARSAAIAFVLGACNGAHPTKVKNDDSVELFVRVHTSDGSLNWEGAIGPGSVASLRFRTDKDVTFRTSVYFAGQIVQEREKGYVSGSMIEQETCITVSRLNIVVSTCE